MKRSRTSTVDPEPGVRTASVTSPPEVGRRLVAQIDKTLLRFTGRTLVAATEAVDLLLDLRAQILLEAALTDPFDATQ